MRPLELLMIAANVAAFVALALPSTGTWLGKNAWPLRAAPPIAALTLGAQLLIEGPRWQMAPAYAMSVLLVVAWLRHIAVVATRNSATAKPNSAAATRNASRSRMIRLARAVGVAAGALALAISAALPVIFPVFRFPRPTGPYGIGTLTYHWVDGDRPEAFTADPDDRRELMVQVWYPAETVPSSPRAPYVDDAGTLAPLAELLGLPTFVFSHLSHVKTNAVPSAAVADADSSYPVLLFSHGRGGYRQHNTWQIEELVSRGYVVAAIDHTYAAAGVVLPDGRMVAFDSRLGLPAPGADWAIPYLAQDAVFVLDQLASLNESDPNGILTGRLDLRRAGVFGVSMGGAISAEACRVDARFRACLVMDVHMPPDVVRVGLRQPTMWLSRDAGTMRLEGWPQPIIDHTQTTMRTVFETLPADGYLILIPGTYHVDYSDAALLSPLASAVGITGPIGGERARSIIGAYSIAFFDQYLKGRQHALLDGPSAQYPEVIFQSRSGGEGMAAVETEVGNVNG